MIPLHRGQGKFFSRKFQKGLKAGFSRYLTKPIKVEELLTALDAALAASLTPNESPALPPS